MRWNRYDVFISYSREDSRLTDTLVDLLRKRGYRVFYDKQSIRVGELWKSQLAKAIRASRTCILCWSEHAQHSEFVRFEYARAEGSGKPVLPWLLDMTPLPAMFEIQGVTEIEASKAVAHFASSLGWRLSLRHFRFAIAMLLASAVAGTAYWRTHLPPRLWDFTGRVIDSETRLPVAGVEVDAERGKFVTFTDTKGRYTLHLPAPKSRYVHLAFLKRGYQGEVPVNVTTDMPFDTDMTRLQQ